MILKLLRVNQWYKNLLVFLAIFFSGNILKIDLLGKVALGFIALCFISSSSYIINDIFDLKYDKKHPEKRKRPIASGRARIWQGFLIAIILFMISVGISSSLSIYFLYSILFLFISTLFYSLFLKHMIFADILTVAINFVVRAISGAFIISVFISPWLILVTFFIALLLATGKRKAESIFLGKNVYGILKQYTPDILNSLTTISATALIVSYSLYCFLTHEAVSLITLPIVLYIIFLYLHQIYNGTAIARRTELVFKDKRFMISFVLFAVVMFLVVYLK